MNLNRDFRYWGGFVLGAIALGIGFHSISVSGHETSMSSAKEDEQETTQNRDAQQLDAHQQNVLIGEVNSAMEAKNWREAVAPLQQLLGADPGNWQFASALGDCFFNLGQYQDAIQSYQKGVAAAGSATTIDPKEPSTDSTKKRDGMARMLISEGNAFMKLGENEEAVDAYTKAGAMMDDPNSATAYYNICAIQYNTGNDEAALNACNKAIAADPNKANGYFIKGALLLASATESPNGNVSVPAGTVEAFTRYLELAPSSPTAKDAKDALAFITNEGGNLATLGSEKPTQGTLEISQDVAAGQLAHKVDPIYPQLAKISHVQGDVVLKALIGTDGSIENLQVEAGHVLLIKAAVDAVKQWQYRPYLLNGTPVEVRATIKVRFHL